jgi:hypothetical protein
MKEKIKLVGQLLDDTRPTVLAIEDNLSKIDPIVKEYKETFPDIFLSCEWGYFKPIISNEKKRVLSLLFGSLTAGLPNILSSLTK